MERDGRKSRIIGWDNCSAGTRQFLLSQLREHHLSDKGIFPELTVAEAQRVLDEMSPRCNVVREAGPA